jgi:hypothetical protein
MPKPRSATKALKARGSFLKHPERQRARSREPKPSGPLGPPPDELKASQKKVWRELAAIIPEGVADASDRWSFEVLVCLMGKFRRGISLGGEVSQMLSLLAKFGMTPVDRSRVAARPEPAGKIQNPWDKLTSSPKQSTK